MPLVLAPMQPEELARQISEACAREQPTGWLLSGFSNQWEERGIAYRDFLIRVAGRLIDDWERDYDRTLD